MDAATRHLIESLHRSPVQYVLAVTGGGTGAAALLLNVPGGSRTVLEVIVPYSSTALSDFLGMPPEHYCSAATARAMSVRAHVRAAWLAPRAAVLGVACTASLASDRPKKGEHRCHVAVHDGRRSLVHSLTLSKGARDREAEEAVVDAVLLNALAEVVGVNERVPIPLLADEQVEKGRLPSFAAQTGPLANPGTADAPILVLPDGQVRLDGPKPLLLVPGSFNPIHAAHWALAEVATRMTGQPAAFEMSITNVDKPPLPVEEVHQRLTQFAALASVWLTRAPTFAEKARLFPGVTFAVGCDTAIRIIDPRYYGNDPARMGEALASIRDNGCRFLVGGRVDASGRFVRCQDLPLPEEFREIFVEIPERDFRLDLSSTELRANGPPPG
jgi:nicotinamide mononucleotide (NMN) deamidase PncC